jgi:SpoVK/Ycf46/Vps4 family AAA+-type ATPase
MVLAATNRPSELDEAILRRFTQIFEIGIPVQSERSKILQVVLKGENVEPNIDYDRVARLCEGFTGSDILELCKQAAFYPIRELLDSEKNGRKLDVSIYFIKFSIHDFLLLLIFISTSDNSISYKLSAKIDHKLTSDNSIVFSIITLASLLQCFS